MQKLTSLFPDGLLGAWRRIPAPKGPFLGRLDLSAGKTSVVSAGWTSVVSAAKTSVVSADKRSAVCQDILWTLQTQGHCTTRVLPADRFGVGNIYIYVFVK